ncbi:MAG: hypothetical protein R3C59_27385 [Planctomycetaceae bacterium]
MLPHPARKSQITKWCSRVLSHPLIFQIWRQSPAPAGQRSAAKDSPLISDDAEIRRALTQLVGLKLAVARRGADMRVLHFGTMRPSPVSTLPSQRDRPRGSIGDFALHIQCPWRIETDDKILTGRTDLWEPLEWPGGFSYDEWDYERDGNVQDLLMENFMANNDCLLVVSVTVQSHCSFTITFNGGHRLLVFPSGSTGEDWRFFRPDSDESHLVVSGGSIERDDS